MPRKNGSKEARTPDLSRVRRTLIPAELCFHISIIVLYHKKSIENLSNGLQKNIYPYKFLRIAFYTDRTKTDQ